MQCWVGATLGAIKDLYDIMIEQGATDDTQIFVSGDSEGNSYGTEISMGFTDTARGPAVMIYPHGDVDSSELF